MARAWLKRVVPRILLAAPILTIAGIALTAVAPDSFGPSWQLSAILTSAVPDAPATTTGRDVRATAVQPPKVQLSPSQEDASSPTSPRHPNAATPGAAATPAPASLSPATTAPGRRDSADPPRPDPLHVDIIVALCNEDVGWLGAVLADLRRQGAHAAVFVYKKCGDSAAPPPGIPDAVVDVLPNVGREAHTYLHHMAARRDRVTRSNVTLYLQGHVHVYNSVTVVQMANALIFQAMKHGLSTNVRNEQGRYESVNDAWYGFRAGLGSLDARWNGTMGEWFDARLSPHLGITFPPNRRVGFFQGACFAVHSALQLPAGVVRAGLEDTSAGNAPAVAHFFERCWFFLLWAVRERLVRAGKAARWRDDVLDPFSLNRRRHWEGGDSGGGEGAVYWDWEGCTSKWVDGGNGKGKMTYACTALRSVGSPVWSWS